MSPNEMVEELMDLGNLTKWEASFLISVGNKLEWGEDLTETELEKLTEIYRERV